MTRYAAFLRGINLGNRRVTNDRLADIIGELDVSDVAPFLASGNVVFDHSGPDGSALEPVFERHLEESLGYPVDTFIRPFAMLDELAGDEALAVRREEGFNPHVIFLRADPSPDARDALTTLEGADDRFDVRGREVVWLRRGKLTDSTIETRHLERALGGVPNTMRNLNTVERIVRKFGG